MGERVTRGKRIVTGQIVLTQFFGFPHWQLLLDCCLGPRCLRPQKPRARGDGPVWEGALGDLWYLFGIYKYINSFFILPGPSPSFTPWADEP